MFKNRIYLNLFYFLYFSVIIYQVPIYSQGQCNCLGYHHLGSNGEYIIHYHDQDKYNGIYYSNCFGYAFSGAQSDMGLPQHDRTAIFIEEEYVRNYWTTWGFYANTNNPQPGDIAIWDDPSTPAVDHAAVLVSYNSFEGMWYVNYVTGRNGMLVQNVPITEWNGEWPDFYLRQVKNIYGYTVTAKTSFGGGKVIVDGVAHPVDADGYMFSATPNSQHMLAVERKQYYNNYWWYYYEWVDFEDQLPPLAEDPDSVAEISVEENLKTYVAKFYRELDVEISGPVRLSPGQSGEFTANPSGGKTPYTNYRWWKRLDSGGPGPYSFTGGGGIEPDAPPPGEWVYLLGEEGKQTIYQDDYQDFSLKCEVTDDRGNTAVDVHSVVVNNLSVQQLEKEHSFAVVDVPVRFRLG